ncbi:hypothetical protein K32_19980 [Kaistia sp. 32K]|nr:hypothetical protein K32_19980 [Kaistia sp. 32K]
MRMEDIGIERLDAAEEPQEGEKIGRRHMPLHRRSVQAQFKMGNKLLEELFLARAARRRVADDADAVALGSLRLGEIADMPEDSADGRTKDVNDP